MTKILIVAADFYKDIADMLIQGATDYLKGESIDYEIVTVPGALEIPAAIAMASDSFQYDGFVALGCVIKGETSHYDYVCQESARGLMDLSINGSLAIGNGILTCYTDEQAYERADPTKGYNKGGSTASAALHMIKLRAHFESMTDYD